MEILAENTHFIFYKDGGMRVLKEKIKGFEMGSEIQFQKLKELFEI